MLKEWVIKYSDGKANPAMVEQWVIFYVESTFS